MWVLPHFSPLSFFLSFFLSFSFPPPTRTHDSRRQNTPSTTEPCAPNRRTREVKNTKADFHKKKKVCDRMMSLKDRCTHPKTHMPYLKTAIGGANVCPEGRMNVGFFYLPHCVVPFHLSHSAPSHVLYVPLHLLPLPFHRPDRDGCFITERNGIRHDGSGMMDSDTDKEANRAASPTSSSPNSTRPKTASFTWRRTRPFGSLWRALRGSWRGGRLLSLVRESFDRLGLITGGGSPG